MTGLSEDPANEAERYRAAIEMAVYAEERGFQTVNLEEHHCAENGWLPAPLTLAAMIIARTKRVRVNIGALLVTLYDPIRLAEDIAILDLVSGGRFSFVAGLGYRPVEYHATGRSWPDRGQLMDECLETLLQAWSGKPFEYRGEKIRVTPSPVSRPHPFFMVGGMRPVAPYFLRELQEYSSWKQEGVPRPGEDAVHSVEDLREQARFTILDAADFRLRFQGSASGSAVVHPLAGGIPIARGWQILERFADALT